MQVHINIRNKTFMYTSAGHEHFLFGVVFPVTQNMKYALPVEVLTFPSYWNNIAFSFPVDALG